MEKTDSGSIPVDVICQHNTTGEIIPIKIRLKDEDDEIQVYRVKSYRRRGANGAYIMPNGIRANENFYVEFECKIEVFEVEKTVQLFYTKGAMRWELRY